MAEIGRRGSYRGTIQSTKCTQGSVGESTQSGTIPLLEFGHRANSAYRVARSARQWDWNAGGVLFDNRCWFWRYHLAVCYGQPAGAKGAPGLAIDLGAGIGLFWTLPRRDRSKGSHWGPRDRPLKVDWRGFENEYSTRQAS